MGPAVPSPLLAATAELAPGPTTATAYGGTPARCSAVTEDVASSSSHWTVSISSSDEAAAACMRSRSAAQSASRCQLLERRARMAACSWCRLVLHVGSDGGSGRWACGAAAGAGGSSDDGAPS